MSLPVEGHGSQKCYKLIGRFEVEVMVSLGSDSVALVRHIATLCTHVTKPAF